MHIRCPHCQNPIEVVGNEEFASVNCPSCGSTFELVSQTLPHDPALHVQLLTPTKQTIAHFELVEQLGSGGFGTVWKARDTKLDRLVAVKVPRIDLHDREHTDMFLREARAAAQLRHPDIVAVHEVGRENGSLYIVSDFIEGVTLANRITASPLAAREAAQLLATVAEALQHAHDAGVIHRDLKPQNIMLDGDGQPKLMDFGLAKRDAGEVTMTIDGKILGTPAYMSPEQARGESHRVDRRTDIYSLGVVLFELLTGERPFRGNQRMLLHQVVHDEPPSPRGLNGRIPRDLETICLKCLEKSPQKRFSTSQELADELRRYLSGQPILARPISRFEHALRWAQNNPVVAGLTSAVVIALLGGTATSTWFAISANQAAAATSVKAQEAINNAALERQQRQRADDETIKARRHLYAAHMNLALEAWEDARVGTALDLLDRQLPQQGQEDLRAFEWHYLNRLCHSSVLELIGHAENVMAVAWSPDGTRIASAGWDFTVRVWDAVTGEELLAISKDLNQLVMCLAFSPDGKQLAASSNENIHVWEAATGEKVLMLKGHSKAVAGIAFSPDGKHLASSSWDHSVKVWDATSGNELNTFNGHTDIVRGISFSPDGKSLASASRDRSVKIWDIAKSQEILTLKGHTNWVECVVFSPNGKQLATASWDKTAKVWDVDSGKLLFTVPHDDSVNCVAFSPDGKRLASAGHDQIVIIVDVSNRRVIHNFRGHTGLINSITFSPAGDRLATAAFDQTIKVWDAGKAQTALTFQARPTGLNFDFSPDGQSLASISNEIIKIWDTNTGRAKLTLSGHSAMVNSIDFSSDGRQLASTSEDQTIKLWDASTGEELISLKGHSKDVYWAVFSPDGGRIASIDRDQEVKIWDATTGVIIQAFKARAGGPLTFRYTSGGKLSGVAYWEKKKDNVVSLWNSDTNDETLVLNAHTEKVRKAAFGQNGKLLATASLDKSIKLWDRATGKELRTLKGHDGSINAITFDQDGKRLASASSDKTVKIWDVATGEVTLTLKGHSTFVADVSFSPNGLRLASVSRDGTIKVWDATPILQQNQRDVPRARIPNPQLFW